MIKKLLFGISAISCLGICTAGPSELSGEREFTFKNSFDGTQQKAVAYIPQGYAGKYRTSLLVVAHYWGGNRSTARDIGYYRESEKRMWLIVCPELHGHKSSSATALASLESQHDIVDAVSYMRKNYEIDSSRIYIAGRSMGGMLIEIMAAKYGDLFAGGVAGQGIADLHAWFLQSPSFDSGITAECGAYGDSTRFEYDRRSSVNYGANLAGFPLIIWHGTNDFIVPPTHSEYLHDSIAKYTRFVTPINWLCGAPHSAANMPPSWECDQLELCQNVCEVAEGVPARFFREFTCMLDEDMSYHWIKITRANQNAFGRVHAAFHNDTLAFECSNVKTLEILPGMIGRQMKYNYYHVKSDGAMELLLPAKGFHRRIGKKGSGEITDSR